MSCLKFVVTGGGGFVGKALCKRLVSMGHQVHSLSRKLYAEHQSMGVQAHACDLAQINPKTLANLFSGAQAVFHVAAKIDMWGSYDDFYRANVLATQNVIDACKLAEVKKLIFTSSPSVIACPKDLCGVDESFPYPERFEAFYPLTKAEAEKLVLAANSSELKTIALRPKLIFGPGDTNLIPHVVAKAKSGKLKRIGDGLNLTDLTFIDDCVEAHILAWQALDKNPAACGKTYFISQGEPVKLWEWIDQVLMRSGMRPLKSAVPEKIARLVAFLAESICKYVLPGKEPFLSRFLISEMCRDHYFNIAAAKRELGYAPRYTVAQALERTFS